MATMKKLRFRKARDIRKFGIDFATARKLANDFVRNGRLTRDDIPTVQRFMFTCGDGCCSFWGVSITNQDGSKIHLNDGLSRKISLPNNARFI